MGGCSRGDYVHRSVASRALKIRAICCVSHKLIITMKDRPGFCVESRVVVQADSRETSWEAVTKVGGQKGESISL